MHVYTEIGNKETIDSLIYSDKGKIWEISLSKQLGCLAQGKNFSVKVTDTIGFIPKSEIPQGKDITYAIFVCEYRPLKYEPYRICLVVGGDILMYEEEADAPAASILESKLLINIVISDAKQGTRFYSYNHKDLFLAREYHGNTYHKTF